MHCLHKNNVVEVSSQCLPLHCTDTMDLSSQLLVCKVSGITSNMLLGDEMLPRLLTVKKGLILELLKIKKTYQDFVTWPIFSAWIKQMVVDAGSFSVNALRKSVLSVESQCQKLKKKVHVDMGEFLNEVYTLPGVKPHSVLPEEKSLRFIASEKLAPEITSLKEEIIRKNAII